MRPLSNPSGNLMFDSLNQTLFALINAPVETGAATVFMATLAAEGLLYIVAILMVLGWVRGQIPMRRALFNAGLAAIIGLAFNQILRTLWPHPRPFAAGYGQQFLEHAADASFPSDHGTILFSIAIALILSKSRFGALALGAALATAWARIFLGVHWPLDMLGSFAVALIAAALACTLFKRPVATLFGLCLKAYQWSLDRLRLPAALFPR